MNPVSESPVRGMVPHEHAKRKQEKQPLVEINEVGILVVDRAYVTTSDIVGQPSSTTT